MKIIGSSKPENIKEDQCTGACYKCGIMWRGNSIAHCKGCHETFGSDSAFDLHRRAFKCVDPKTLKKRDGSAPIYFDPDLGVWKFPKMPSGTYGV